MYHNVTLKELMYTNVPEISEQKKFSYQPTLREARALHKLINKEIFYGKLPMPKIVLIPKMHGCWGECFGIDSPFKKNRSRCTITMPDSWFCQQWFITLLAHEMVHQYQWDIYSQIRTKKGKESIMSHGPSFYIFRERLRRVGIPLKEGYSKSRWFKHQDLFKC